MIHYNYRRPITWIEMILPIIIMLTCLVNVVFLLVAYKTFWLAPAFLLVVGVATLVLFFLRHPWTEVLIQVWIWSQLFVFGGVELATTEGGWSTGFFWNASPILRVIIGIIHHGSDDLAGAGVNILPIIYAIVYFTMASYQVLGREVKLFALKKDARNASLFPAQGLLIRKVAVGGKKEWYMVDPGEGFEVGGKPYRFYLIKSKAGENFKTMERQAVVIRLVPEGQEVGKQWNDTKHFPRADLAVVEMQKRRKKTRRRNENPHKKMR